ncbi:hypothetical protein [Amantichitinum ursilacus]|uniref:Uncharacterized protein n=1 Tax=Amantichitinum ursilacus TaxID=857265 RepID=A0A0N0GLS6_9NEIS|nr:hypothetical protein [Amantichitinum ursilacus]KPC50184.1 hypothetical protein WG78_18305 [Amantichitinum ursilacus]
MATAEYKSVPHSSSNSRILGIEHTKDNPEIIKLIFDKADLIRAGLLPDIPILASLLNGNVVLSPYPYDTADFDAATGRPL